MFSFCYTYKNYVEVGFQTITVPPYQIMYSNSQRMDFESGLMTDAYMIFLLRVLGLEEVDVIRQLSACILSLQNDSGFWSLFYDEPLSGYLSATVEAYDALLASGYCNVEDESMQQARIPKAVRLNRRMLWCRLRVLRRWRTHPCKGMLA